MRAWLAAAQVEDICHGDSMDTDSNKLVPIFDDETEVTVRILPDRVVADFFVQGGR
jgi:hypothetical protein